MDINQLKKELRRDEGFRSKPYTDTVGKLTIGVGRNLTDRGIRDDEAELMLSNDVTEVLDDLSNSLAWFDDLDEVRQRALANMAFNLGVTGLLKFKKTLDLIRKEQYDLASKELMNSKWAKQVGARAKRLSYMIRTGSVL